MFISEAVHENSVVCELDKELLEEPVHCFYLLFGTSSNPHTEMTDDITRSTSFEELLSFYKLIGSRFEGRKIICCLTMWESGTD